MPKENDWNKVVSRIEYNQRAREARLQLEHLERSLAKYYTQKERPSFWVLRLLNFIPTGGRRRAANCGSLIGDRRVNAETGRYLGNHIPGAQYVELPGADHTPLHNTDRIADETGEFLSGSRHEIEADRVLATVLFTDIVDSTKRAAELGDRQWRALLDRHDAVVRAQIGRYRGQEVKSLGDGFLATFDGPARAVRCAAAIAGMVHPLGLTVRSGLHTGEIELTRDDIGGIAVHTAARVLTMAGAGETLVSSTVRDLAAGSGLRFEDRGRHALRGLPEEVHLYTVLGG